MVYIGMIIALIIACLSVYWYIKLMTKDNKTKKQIWIALLCLWGAILSIGYLYVTLITMLNVQ
ncbi:MAG: hypothetical protein K6G69_07980 [Lachnospiraceae bacterium]|nr:hypothetical protein [Lachnospiraceae bacterium]